MSEEETNQTKLEDVRTVLKLESIILQLLVSNTSEWIIGEGVNEFIKSSNNTEKEIITKIQQWLAHNKLTRTRARFLEKYCNVKEVTLQRYLGLAWSVLFFDGIKLNDSTKVILKPILNKNKQKSQINTFYYTLDRIKHKHKLTNKGLLDVSKLLQIYIKANKMQTFKYYGVPKEEWRVNHVSYNFLKKDQASIN